MSDLRNYISQIKKSRELKTIKTNVSTKYEIAGVTAKVDGSDAVLFENIKESNFRLVANLVGTRKRFALAVGTTEDNIHKKVISAINNTKRPKIISSGKFMENKSKNILSMPIVRHFEKESGPFITSSIAYVKNPETGKQNSSFHRMMTIDKTHYSITMVEGSAGLVRVKERRALKTSRPKSSMISLQSAVQIERNSPPTILTAS